MEPDYSDGDIVLVKNQKCILATLVYLSLTASYIKELGKGRADLPQSKI